jgi:hypothetical protein
MPRIIKPFTFLASLVGGWWSLMSGFISIPLNFFALFSNGTHPKWWFALSGIFTLWICIGIMAYKNYPKFKLSCSSKIPKCVTPALLNDQIKFIRVVVEVGCVGGIKNCLGHLEKIEKDGQVVFENDYIELPFAQSTDEKTRFNKTIHNSSPEMLDVLAIVTIKPEPPPEIIVRAIMDGLMGYTQPRDRYDVHIATPMFRRIVDKNGNNIFEKAGEYILYINVVGDDAPAAKAKLKFTWTGNINTSTIEKIT